MKNQIIFVLTAASATGKTSCAKLVCERGSHLSLSISYTTRPIRPGEIEGVDKFFISKEQFSNIKKKQGFVEESEMYGHQYGHTNEKLEEVAGKDNDLIMILDYQGLCQVKKWFENVVCIFLLPPSMDELQNRIHKRPEAPGVCIDSKMRSAKKEMRDYDQYDYTVFNDDLETCVEDILAIVKSERLRTENQKNREKNRLNLLFKG